MEKEKLKLIDIMSIYKFSVAKEYENSTDIVFINENDILCRVYAFERFEFIYTNDCMLGMLTSGVFELYNTNIGQFEQILIEFTETVNKLKDAYNIG